MPKRPSVPPRRPLRSTSATPCSSQASSNPFWAAHRSGPIPPGPPPTATDEYGPSTANRSAEHIAEHPDDPIDDLAIDGARRRQVYAGRRQSRAVWTGAGIFFVLRHRRKGVEKPPQLELVRA